MDKKTILDYVVEIHGILQKSNIWAPELADHWARFWNLYKKEADEWDHEFLTRYREDMNTSMIFVSILTFLSNAVVLIVTSLDSSLLSPRRWRA